MNAEKARKNVHPSECPHCNEFSRFQGNLCERCREWLRKAAEMVKP